MGRRLEISVRRAWRIAAAFLVTAGMILYVGSCKAKPADFSGDWEARLDGAYFELYLIQDETNIHGFHNAGLNDASRIDSAIGTEEESLKGKVDGKEATVNITSYYSEGVSYQAAMRLNDDGSMAWKVIKRQEGETFIPLETVMTRFTPVFDGEAPADPEEGD